MINVTNGTEVQIELQQEDKNFLERICTMAAYVAGLSNDEIYNSLLPKFRPQDNYKLRMPNSTVALDQHAATDALVEMSRILRQNAAIAQPDLDDF